MDDKNDHRYQHLRKIAEEKLNWVKINNIKDEEFKKVITELNIHQIELELQNAELRNTQQILEKTRDELCDLYDFAPVGYCTLDKNGLITNLNLTLSSMIGIPRKEMTQTSFFDYIHRDDKDAMFFHLRGLFDHNKDMKKSTTLRVDSCEGQRVVQVSSSLMDDGCCCRTAVVDVTEKMKAERALKESEKKYRTYINSAPNGVFICDENGRYVEVNEKSVEITGYSKDELLQMSIAEITADEGKEIGLKHFQTLLENGQSSGEASFVHKDGSLHWWQVNAVKLSDTRFLGFTHDITQKKQMEQILVQSKKETEMILNTAGDGIRIVTKDFKIKTMNDTFSEMINTPKSKAVGVYCYNIFKSKYCGTEECSMVRVLKTGKGFEKEDIRTNPDGKKITCILKVTPYRDENDKIIGIMEDYRDITSIKESEKKLQQAHDELNRMNLRLEEEVDDRTRKIQQLLVQKDEMINQMGHDLKNPLGPIINLMPVLMKYEDDPKKLEMMNAVQQSAKYMKNLVMKSIKLAKINSDIIDFHFESLCLNDVVSEVVAANQLLFSEHDIMVDNRIDGHLFVHADKVQLQELFSNLLNNAVKYTDGNGSVVVEAEQVDDMIQVSVRDQGVGMTGEQLEKVFDEFYKADSSRHDFDSSGLGLSICKRIVEKYGGWIWVESPGLGKGSTFYLTLPKKVN